MFEKVSRSLKYDSNIFFVHKHIYGWTPQPITLPRSHCACGVKISDYLSKRFLYNDMDNYLHEDNGMCLCCDICVKTCECGLCAENQSSFTFLS